MKNAQTRKNEILKTVKFVFKINKMEDYDFFELLLFDNEKIEEKSNELKKKINVYYYKGEDGIKCQINLREYFKMIKVSKTLSNIHKTIHNF